MKITLIAAEFEENLALRYLWSALEERGHQVEFIRFNGAEDADLAATALAGSAAAIAAFSMVFTARALEFVQLAERARELGFTGYAVAGGHFATLHGEELLARSTAFDAVGCGEGETLLVELAEHLDCPSQVRGLIWKDAGGGLHRNEPAQPQVDLERLAAPVHRRPFDVFLGIPAANIIGSRGCLHSCSFCSISAWHRHCGGPRLRLRAPAAVAEEMAGLYRDGVRIFNFHDDNFFLPTREQSLARFQALDREWKQRGIRDIAFAVKARPDEIDAELVDCLLEMGLFRIFLGIEGGTETTLTQLGRGQRLEDNERALAILGQRRLQTCFNLLFLNPDSTLADFRANVVFLARHPEHPMNFCRTEVYAGTGLEANLRRQGRLQGDLWGLDYVLADPQLEQAYEAVRRILRGRSQGIQCLNHQAMLVDFELQLLERFYGASGDLRADCERFVRRLNGDTAQRLLAIVQWAERADFSDSARCDQALAAAEAADAQFSLEAQGLTRRIRACAGRAQAPAGFRVRLPWAAAILVAGSALLGQGPAPVPGQAPKPVEQGSELEELRQEVGTQIAVTGFPGAFLALAKPTVVLKVELDGRGQVKAVQALVKAQLVLPGEVDGALTGLLPSLTLRARPNLAGCTLLMAFHQAEFVAEAPSGRMDVTLRPAESMICEVVAASPRDGVSIRKR